MKSVHQISFFAGEPAPGSAPGRAALAALAAAAQTAMIAAIAGVARGV